MFLDRLTFLAVMIVRLFRRMVPVLCLAATGILVPASARAAAGAGDDRPRDGAGLTVVARHWADSRLLKVTVRTAALPSAAHVDVLFPRGYAAHPERRYPVLYLLHGTEGGADDWTTLGGAEQATADLPLIVVMPDIALNATGGGWCTNWVNGGRYGVPEWETFHIGQLVPWVDANLRTRATRAGRAVAGVSQGGFCAMSYAARHPDLFATAVSYSGAPDIAYDPAARLMAWSVISTTEVALDQAPIGSMFGGPVTDRINWSAHDPATLAPNLRDTKLMLYNGNGAAGPYDTLPISAGTPVEFMVGIDNQLFHRRLTSLGIRSRWDDYGAGTHTWPYWTRDLARSLGPVMTAFRHPAPAPDAVTYTSAENTYAVYGWTVRLRRATRAFSTLKDATRRGFALVGSGSAQVVTPAGFVAGGRYSVREAGPGGTVTVPVTADAAGRLHLNVRLGTRSRTTTVSIRKAAER